MDSAGLLRPKTTEGAAVQLAAYLVSNPPAPDDPHAAVHRVALESVGIIGTTLAPSAPPAGGNRSPHHGSGSRRRSSRSPDKSPRHGRSSRRKSPAKDAHDDITQHKIDKARHRRAARVGFEGDDSEDSQDGELRGAECFHYRIREAMPPRRFKPSPVDADRKSVV